MITHRCFFIIVIFFLQCVSVVAATSCISDQKLLDRAFILCRASARCRESFFIESPSTSNTIVEATQRSYFENEFLAMMQETHTKDLASGTLCTTVEGENSVQEQITAVASQWLLVVMENHFVCPVNQFLNENQECVCRHDKICIQSADHTLLLKDSVYYVVSAVIALAALYHYSFLLNRVAQIEQAQSTSASAAATNTTSEETKGNGTDDGGDGERGERAAAATQEEDSRQKRLQDYTELTRAGDDITIGRRMLPWEFNIK